VVLVKVFTYRFLELISYIIVINGRHPDVRVENSVILIGHMFWAKMPTFPNSSVTSKGYLFFAWFSKVFMS